MKRTPALLLLSLCAAPAAAVAVAAEARPPQAQPQPQPPSIERRRRPQQRQEMKKLAFLVGTFRAASSRRPDQPAVRRENAWEAGGSFLSLRLRSTGGGGGGGPDPSVSLDVIGYDLGTETFRATVYGPFSNGTPEVVTCALEGRKLVIPSRHGHSRRTFQESAAGILVRTERRDGGRWVTVAESAFTRLR